jgi:hypothetical protein
MKATLAKYLLTAKSGNKNSQLFLLKNVSLSAINFKA